MTKLVTIKNKTTAQGKDKKLPITNFTHDFRVLYEGEKVQEVFVEKGIYKAKLKDGSTIDNIEAPAKVQKIQAKNEAQKPTPVVEAKSAMVTSDKNVQVKGELEVVVEEETAEQLIQDVPDNDDKVLEEIVTEETEQTEA